MRAQIRQTQRQSHSLTFKSVANFAAPSKYHVVSGDAWLNVENTHTSRGATNDIDVA